MVQTAVGKKHIPGQSDIEKWRSQAIIELHLSEGFNK